MLLLANSPRGISFKSIGQAEAQVVERAAYDGLDFRQALPMQLINDLIRDFEWIAGKNFTRAVIQRQCMDFIMDRNSRIYP